MKFLIVSVYDNYLHKNTTDRYINIDHIVYFAPYYFMDNQIDYTRMIIKLIGEKDPLRIKYNIENFKDNLIKLHSNHTHII